MWLLRTFCCRARVSCRHLCLQLLEKSVTEMKTDGSRSLLLLHSRYPLVTADTLSNRSVGGFPPDCLVASSVACQTIIRMIVDISQTINAHYFDINVLSFPPSYSHVVYRATLELISFHGDMDNTEWTAALETLREATWNYGRRWQAAGM
jgi:hypothetical protein